MNDIKIPARREVAEKNKWRLEDLFSLDEKWEDLFREVETRISGITQFAGQLALSAQKLKDVIEFDLSLSRDLERLHTYAHLKHDEDQADQHYLGFFQRVQTLINRAVEYSSFLRPEIMAIQEAVMAEFLASSLLEPYRFYLEKILRERPHTRSVAEEELLAMSRVLTQVPSQIFGQLDNVDIKFGSIADEQGRKIELSHGNFTTFLITPDRKVRERAFFHYYQSYQMHKNTLASILAGSVKADLFNAKARAFGTCRAKALFADDIALDVYDNLIFTVRENLASLFDYLMLRKKVLNLSDLHFYDTYVPIVGDIKFELPFEEAVSICLEALQPLGNEYLSVLEKGLLEGWVDRYENQGKRSGAYSSGCYDSSPYILMNYEPRNINSLYTLIHEAGHSMHTYYACRNQPYIYHDYTIFVAEVASTFNETLLSNHLLKHYKDDARMQAYIVNREIDNIRGTLFRQTMFAEFERSVHDMAENHQPLTLENMTNVYEGLLKDYFGGCIVIDEPLKLEFLRIPHFYRAFYVYKYATGISAAIFLAKKVTTEGEPAVNHYLDFLKMGGSCFPLKQLMAAGVDMAGGEPVKEATAHFADLVKRLSQALLSL